MKLRRSSTELLTTERDFTFPRDVVEKAVLKAYVDAGIILPKERKAPKIKECQR